MACSDPHAAHNMLDLCLLSHAHARVLSLSYLSLYPSPQSPWQPRSSPTTPFSKPRDTCGQSGSFKSSREVVNTRPTSHYRSIPSHTFHTPGLGASFPPLSRRESSRVFERVSGKRSSTRGARAREGGGSIAITPRELCAAIGMVFGLALLSMCFCQLLSPHTR